MESIFWVIALVVLLLIEVTTLGLTTIWFAGGALIAFLASLISAPLWLQIVLFIIVSVVLLIFTRPLAANYLNRQRTKTNYEGLVGKIAKVTARVDNFNQTGTAAVNGLEWTVRAAKDDEIIEPGTRVKIVDITGVKLIVIPYHETEE